MSDYDEIYLGGIPLDDKVRRGVPYHPVPGAKQEPCSKCGSMCWLGPQQIAQLAKGVKVMCPPCMGLILLTRPSELTIMHLGGKSGTKPP